MFSSSDEEAFLDVMDELSDPAALGSSECAQQQLTERPPRKRVRLRQNTAVGRVPLVDKWDRRAQNCGLPKKVLRRLFAMGWPIMLFNLMVFANDALGKPVQNVSCIELFSGVATVAGAFREHGYTAIEYDIIRQVDNENINTAAGFMTALRHAARLQGNAGLGHWATVSSTWVFMSRGCTGRTRQRPYGSPGAQF
jgi:hypothetical protein